MNVKHSIVNFSHASATLLEEIDRNLSALYSTPAGTCAGDRSYGLAIQNIGKPAPVAENLLALEIIEKTEIYEPRVTVLNISQIADHSGKITNIVTVGPNESYEEPEDDEEEEYEDEDDGSEEYED